MGGMKIFFRLLVLVLAIAGVSVYFWRGIGEASREYPLSGTVECDEVHVGSRYGGRVSRIHWQEGDTLPPGALIVELDAPELTARLEAARAALSEALNGPRPQEIAAAKSEWEALSAELNYARSDVRRLRELLRQGSTAQAELDAAESKAAYLEKSAEAAHKRYELLVAGTRPERIAQVRAQLAEAEALLTETIVCAPPTTSVLESLNVKVGDILTAGREVATLILEDHLYVRVYVPATWLGYLKVGDEAIVVPDAMPDCTARATIEQIARAAEFTPRNVQTPADRIEQVYAVKLRLAPTAQLRPGMTVAAKFANVPKPPPQFRHSGRIRAQSSVP